MLQAQISDTFIPWCFLTLDTWVKAVRVEKIREWWWAAMFLPKFIWLNENETLLSTSGKRLQNFHSNAIRNTLLTNNCCSVFIIHARGHNGLWGFVFHFLPSTVCSGPSKSSLKKPKRLSYKLALPVLFFRAAEIEHIKKVCFFPQSPVFGDWRWFNQIVMISLSDSREQHKAYT